MMMQVILKDRLIKVTAIIIIAAICNLSFVIPETKSIKLPAGTPVTLETDQAIDSKTAKLDDKIFLRVKHNVIVEGVVVISAGSNATGHYVKCTKSKGIGQPGYLEIKVDEVTAIDGSVVNVSSPSLAREGDDREGLSLGLSIGGFLVIGPFSLFFLLIKGENARIEPRTQITANVISTTEINVN